ncbi:MAG: aminotransferase class V-fold PLP-dependent enzyme, partial [Gemmatimonadota bacterium]
MPPDLSVMNAANLCPSSIPVLETLDDANRQLDRNPVPSVRSEMLGAKEPTRDRVAAFLRVTPEEILLTRNTSEANNWISAGLDLGPGDEVLIFADNHPSLNQAWKARAERFGYAVREVDPVTSHPGFEYYVEAFARAITPNTRVLAFTHLTNTAGDLMPARELCRLARERGVLSVVDGAQSFGLLDVDLSDVRPDFFTGSAHKWPCGPKEAGVLYAAAEVHDRFHPSIYSAYSGRRGLSRTHEGLGQRDEPALRAFGRQIDFLTEIGQHEIEARSRDLASALIEGLTAIDGVRMWTSPDPTRRAAVVTFQPGELEPAAVIRALEADGIVAASRGGSDRPGIRFSPHYYNSFEDVERGVEAIGRYMRQGS